jgi:hypothetical protein
MWVIPSAPWALEVRTIMETFQICMNDAARLLREHNTADAVFEYITNN